MSKLVTMTLSIEVKDNILDLGGLIAQNLFEFDVFLSKQQKEHYLFQIFKKVCGQDSELQYSFFINLRWL